MNTEIKIYEFMHERHNSSIIIYCRCRRQRPKSTVMETHSKFTVYITLILLCCVFFFQSRQIAIAQYVWFFSSGSVCISHSTVFITFIRMDFYIYLLFIYSVMLLLLQTYRFVWLSIFCVILFFFLHIFVVVSFVSFLPKRYGQNTPLMATFRFQIIHYMRANQ